MSFDKKRAAAAAAVMQYLQTEQISVEPVAAAPSFEKKQHVVAVPDRSMLPAVRPFGLSGRSEQMQTRIMMQLKAFRG